MRHVFLTVGLILSLYAAMCFLTENPIALDDGLRHFVLAEKMRETGIGSVVWGDFLVSGYFTEHRVDPWFLADLLYVPFTLIPDRIIGIKAAGFAFASFMLLCFLPFLRLYKPAPLLAVLALLTFAFGSDFFAYRALIARPLTIMTGLFLLTIFFIVRRRFVLLLPLLIFCTLFSHLFVFPLAVCMVASVWLLLLHERPAAIRCMGFAMTGVVLGFLLHPWPIEYLLWLKNYFFSSPFSGYVGLGSELYSGLGFLDMSPYLILAACVLLTLHCALRKELLNVFLRRKELLLYAVLTMGLFGAYMVWGRILDFLWPVMILLLISLATVSDAMQRDVAELLMRPFTRFRMRGIHMYVAILLVPIGILTGVYIFGGDSRRNLSFADPILSLPADSIIFNLDWDYIPPFLFLRSDMRYIRGADPTLDDVDVSALLRRAEDPLLQKRITVFQRLYLAFSGETPLESEPMTIEDARTWITDVRREINPDYIIFDRARWKRLHDTLRQIPELPVFTENDSVAVYRLE